MKGVYLIWSKKKEVTTNRSRTNFISRLYGIYSFYFVKMIQTLKNNGSPFLTLIKQTAKNSKIKFEFDKDAWGEYIYIYLTDIFHVTFQLEVLTNN